MSQGEIASGTKSVTCVSVSSFPHLRDWRRPADRLRGLKATLALVTIESPEPLFLPLFIPCDFQRTELPLFCCLRPPSSDVAGRGDGVEWGREKIVK